MLNAQPDTTPSPAARAGSGLLPGKAVTAGSQHAQIGQASAGFPLPQLMPACADCSHIKGEHVPTEADTTSLHPYLDHIDEDTWLDPQVVHNSPSWVNFFVSPPPGWVDCERSRNSPGSA